MKNETCDILVPNELKNVEQLTVQLGLQRNRSFIMLFERSLMFMAQTNANNEFKGNNTLDVFNTFILP